MGGAGSRGLDETSAASALFHLDDEEVVGERRLVLEERRVVERRAERHHLVSGLQASHQRHQLVLRQHAVDSLGRLGPYDERRRERGQSFSPGAGLIQLMKKAPMPWFMNMSGCGSEYSTMTRWSFSEDSSAIERIAWTRWSLCALVF